MGEISATAVSSLDITSGIVPSEDRPLPKTAKAMPASMSRKPSVRQWITTTTG